MFCFLGAHRGLVISLMSERVWSAPCMLQGLESLSPWLLGRWEHDWTHSLQRQQHHGRMLQARVDVDCPIFWGQEEVPHLPRAFTAFPHNNRQGKHDRNSYPISQQGLGQGTEPDPRHRMGRQWAVTNPWSVSCKNRSISVQRDKPITATGAMLGQSPLPGQVPREQPTLPLTFHFQATWCIPKVKLDTSDTHSFQLLKRNGCTALRSTTGGLERHHSEADWCPSHIRMSKS